MRKLNFRLNLSQKIVFSSLTVFLSVFILCLSIIGHWFTDNLEQNIRQEVASFAERVYHDFQRERENLITQVDLIADQDNIRLAIEQQDKQKLLQTLLPIRTALRLDWIKIVDNKGNTLLDTRHVKLLHDTFLDQAIISSVSNGAIFTDLINIRDSQKVIQVVIHPIKSPTKIVGGIILGDLVNDNFLRKIATGSSKHIITTNTNGIIATTLPEGKHIKWQPVASNLNTEKVVIAEQKYLAKSVVFEGASQSLITTVLYPIFQLEAAQDLLWLRLKFLFLLGGTFVTIIGFLIGKAVTRPLQAVTQVAQQATKYSNFDLQAPITTQDEVGTLAISLNQLIQQVKQLLAEQYQAKEKLEFYNQTLEQKVIDRTQNLRKKNTDLKQALVKLKKTQAQLIQTEKMSSLGQLVAGVAHEINNPVSFIYGNLEYAEQYIQDILRLIQLYQKNYPETNSDIQKVIQEIELEYLIEDLPQMLTSMKSGAERIRQIVFSLRTFSRLDEAEFKAANVHEGIDSSLLILQHRLKLQASRSEIQVVKEYCEMPPIKCFAGQLNQVFMNILTNAIDALDEAWERKLCLHPLIRISSEYDNENLTICITNNGTDISQEVQAHLFEPFFTTKPIGKGIGMGLSISYQIITEKHGGSLKCSSFPGKGAEFIMTIPIR